MLTLAHGIEYVILGHTSMYILTGGVAMLVTLTEVWSILENMNTLNPDGPWKIIGDFLKKKGSDYLGIDLTKMQQDV
jgi:hypothetical protein